MFFHDMCSCALICLVLLMDGFLLLPFFNLFYRVLLHLNVVLITIVIGAEAQQHWADGIKS